MKRLSSDKVYAIVGIVFVVIVVGIVLSLKHASKLAADIKMDLDYDTTVVIQDEAGVQTAPTDSRAVIAIIVILVLTIGFPLCGSLILKKKDNYGVKVDILKWVESGLQERLYINDSDEKK